MNRFIKRNTYKPTGFFLIGSRFLKIIQSGWGHPAPKQRPRHYIIKNTTFIKKTMVAKKRKKLSFVESIRLIKKAGLNEGALLKAGDIRDLPLEELNLRIKKLLNIYESVKKTQGMIFFVMYDIENNKVRTHISKFLIRKGCVRIQKSVFIAQKPRDVFDELHKTLKEVQDMYDNEDSILLMPVSTDEIHAMRVIGRNISFEMITESKNTLIF